MGLLSYYFQSDGGVLSSTRQLKFDMMTDYEEEEELKRQVRLLKKANLKKNNKLHCSLNDVEDHMHTSSLTKVIKIKRRNSRRATELSLNGVVTNLFNTPQSLSNGPSTPKSERTESRINTLPPSQPTSAKSSFSYNSLTNSFSSAYSSLFASVVQDRSESVQSFFDSQNTVRRFNKNFVMQQSSPLHGGSNDARNNPTNSSSSSSKVHQESLNPEAYSLTDIYRSQEIIQPRIPKYKLDTIQESNLGNSTGNKSSTNKKEEENRSHTWRLSQVFMNIPQPASTRLQKYSGLLSVSRRRSSSIKSTKTIATANTDLSASIKDSGGLDYDDVDG